MIVPSCSLPDSLYAKPHRKFCHVHQKILLIYRNALNQLLQDGFSPVQFLLQ